MIIGIDKTYRTEKLLDWERKSLKDKNSIFSFSKKSTWLGIGFIIIGLSFLGLIVPFIPPRYGWSNWVPATTIEEYQLRVSNFIIGVPIIIIVLVAYVNTRNKIDLILGVKRIANFKITNVIDLEVAKILILNGWRIFSVKANQPYFISASPGQVITIKRTGTFKLFDYCVRDKNTYITEQTTKKASH